MDNPSAIAYLRRCVDCKTSLTPESTPLKCSECGRVYQADENGVWNFMVTASSTRKIKIYQEPEFSKWQQIFNEHESKNWIIYKNLFFRFFSQAGHRAIAKDLLCALKDNAWTLEIGAGQGALKEHFPGDNYIAVDSNKESLSHLKRRWPQTLCIQASSDNLPLSTAAISQVASLHTLEHIYHLGHTLEEIGRVMSSNGSFHYVIPTEGGLGFWLGRVLITGPNLKKRYGLDVHMIMDREHINDAPRVMKFLRMYFLQVKQNYWPLFFLRFLSPNAMISGVCRQYKFAKSDD